MDFLCLRSYFWLPPTFFQTSTSLPLLGVTNLQLFLDNTMPASCEKRKTKVGMIKWASKTESLTVPTKSLWPFLSTPMMFNSLYNNFWNLRFLRFQNEPFTFPYLLFSKIKVSDIQITGEQIRKFGKERITSKSCREDFSLTKE